MFIDYKDKLVCPIGKSKVIVSKRVEKEKKI